MAKVQLQTTLARNYTMEGIDKAVSYLLIKAAPENITDTASLPLNISLVLDVSGSMSGDKLACAKEAACLVVESLSRNDSLALVVFNGEAEVIVPRRKVEDKNAFFSCIKEISASDGTNIFRGMEKGLKELEKAEIGINRIFLFTDGQTNGEEECLDLAHTSGERKIPISCFGIGDDYNEDLLAEISRVTLGAVCHLQRPDQMKEEFAQELKAAGSVGFTNASLGFSLAKGVTLQEIHRIMPNLARLDKSITDERNCMATAGELAGNEPTYFGARLSLPNRSAGQVRIARVTLSYDIPSVEGKSENIQSDVIVEYTKDRDLCGKINPEVMGYFDQLAAQELVEQAARAAKSGNNADATQKLGQAKTLTQRIGNVAMTRHLDQAMGELQKNGTISAGSQKTIRLGSSKTVRIDTAK